jgi:hypothetical protein
MAKAPERGLNIYFINGSSMKVSFPMQTEDKYKRKLMVEEMLKKRVLIIEAEEAIHCIPFENIKYLSIYPVDAADVAQIGAIKGAQINE